MLDKYLKVWYYLITVREEPAGDKGGNDNDKSRIRLFLNNAEEKEMPI